MTRSTAVSAAPSRPDISQVAPAVVDVAVNHPPGAAGRDGGHGERLLGAANRSRCYPSHRRPPPPTPPPPPTVGGAVSGVLGLAGLGPLAPDSPPTPVDSPVGWAVLALVRSRRFGQEVTDEPSDPPSTPIQNSQTINGLVTGDLTAAGDQGDRQALADPSITALSAPLTVDVASATTTSTTFARVKAAAPRTRDTTAPTVSLTGPTAGATVSGTITLTATASDNVGVTKVQFMDGTQLLAENPNSPYSASWNTTTVANGTHILTARAFDAAGNTKTSTSVTITVNNADTTHPGEPHRPAKGATVSGRVTLTATASDDVGVTKVQFLLDGARLGDEVTTPNPYSVYSVSWNTTTQRRLHADRNSPRRRPQHHHLVRGDRHRRTRRAARPRSPRSHWERGPTSLVRTAHESMFSTPAIPRFL